MGGSPKTPAREAEAPVAPATTTAASERKRRANQSQSTLLTSGRGVTNGAPTETKTLLGA